MFSLLLLAGVLLAIHGPEVQVQGALDDAAELRAQENFLNRIIVFERELLQQEAKRRLENEEQARILAENKEESRYPEVIEENPLQEEIQLDVDENREEGGKTEEKTATLTTEAIVAHKHPENPEALSQPSEGVDNEERNDFFMIVIIAGCSVAGLIGLIMAGVCWYKLHSRVKAASDVEYPAYGVTGPTKERLPSPGDRKLAQSAQMYHYQHQKQQMIAMEKANGEMKQDASEDESEEENEEGDYTVYECPGLAPAGEMEVRNPLFTEESQTPVNGQPPAVNGVGDDDTAE